MKIGLLIFAVFFSSQVMAQFAGGGLGGSDPAPTGLTPTFTTVTAATLTATGFLYGDIAHVTNSFNYFDSSLTAVTTTTPGSFTPVIFTTWTIPAGALSANGNCVEFGCDTLYTDGTANSRATLIYFNTVIVSSSAGATLVPVYIESSARFCRTSATTVVYKIANKRHSGAVNTAGGLLIDYDNYVNYATGVSTVNANTWASSTTISCGGFSQLQGQTNFSYAKGVFIP